MMEPLPPKEEPFVNCHLDDDTYYVFDQRTRRAPRDGEGRPLFFVEVNTLAGFGYIGCRDTDGAPDFGRDRIVGDFSKLWMGKKGG